MKKQSQKSGKNIGEKIDTAMHLAGLTQETLAEKLGIKQQGVSRWITGTSMPRITTLKKIASATGQPLQYFFDNSVNITTGNHSPISNSKPVSYVSEGEQKYTSGKNNDDEKEILTQLALLEKEKEILALKLKLLGNKKGKKK